MKRNIHACEIFIEYTIQRRRMRLQSQLRRDALAIARSIGERSVGLQDKLVANSELVVGNDVGVPHRVACRVTKPVGVLSGGVADVIYLICGVILVNVIIYTIYGAMDLIGCVLDFPESANWSIEYFEMLDRQ